MTIRQSIAMLYALMALGFLALQTAPVLGSAMTTLEAAVEPRAALGADLTGHAEYDDLPAYLTDRDGHAEY